MKKAWWLILIFVVVGLLAVGCASDDDEDVDGDEDGDTPAEDGDEPQEDGDEGGEPQSCDPEAAKNFGGMMKAACDTKVGVCETAVVDGQAWFPCVDDPDCCCDPEDTFADDIYACEFDSCVDDGFCDPLCNAGVDPDC